MNLSIYLSIFTLIFKLNISLALFLFLKNLKIICLTNWAYIMENILSSIKKSLRKKAYTLKPIVIIGQNGFTDAALD